MVTDEEYKALQTRVYDLENKMKLLSQQYSSMLMKNDMKIVTDPKHEEHKKYKDVTRYEFKGKQLCKRQLVLECVKQYISDYNISSYEDIIKKFPDYIQGSLGVVKRIEDAEIYSNASKRFYFKDEDIIQFEDGKYVVCSQWDANNIKRFVRLIEDLGYEIKAIERKYID